MIWVFPVAPCSRILFVFRVLVPVNSPTCGSEKSLNSFTFPSTQRTKRSNDAFRVTQHCSIFRPVHSGINYIFEVLCALRPWRRRESDSHTAASVPFNRAALSGHALLRGLASHSFTPSRLSFCPRLRGIRFVIPYLFSGRGLGLPPRRLWLSTFISHCMSFTLLRLLCLLGPPGGFQVATTGKTKSSIGKVFPIDRAVQEITIDIHVVARRRLGFFCEEKMRRVSNAPQECLRGSSWFGLVLGLLLGLSLVFLLSPGFFGFVCPLGRLCLSRFLLSNLFSDGTPTE